MMPLVHCLIIFWEKSVSFPIKKQLAGWIKVTLSQNLPVLWIISGLTVHPDAKPMWASKHVWQNLILSYFLAFFFELSIESLILSERTEKNRNWESWTSELSEWFDFKLKIMKWLLRLYRMSFFWHSKLRLRFLNETSNICPHIFWRPHLPKPYTCLPKLSCLSFH